MSGTDSNAGTTGTPNSGADADAGVTLLEVVVGMSIMSVFLAMFTGAMITLIRTQNRAEALTTSAQEVNVAFQRLDRQVRYANAVSAPGIANGSWYVEFLTATNPASPVCTQLRVTTGTRQLQRRSWAVPANAGAVPTASAWLPLASNVTNGAATGSATATSSPPAPFVLAANPPSVSFEQLSIQLVSVSGNPVVTSSSTQTFTALNSTNASQLAASDPTGPSRVCNQAGVGRP